MSITKENLPNTITFELPFHSRLTKKMILDLDNLLDLIEPKEIKDNLTNFFIQTLSTYNHKDEDIQIFGNMAEDFYFLYQFLTSLEEEILKCEE